MRDAGDGVAQVELDYVTPRFRDFTPGRVRLPEQRALPRPRLPEVVTPPGMVAPYYAGLGFATVTTPDGPAYALDLAAPSTH